MGFTFTKATKRESRLRLALMGPSGSGKTYSALRIARGLGGRIACIDTERGSASKYADVADFDVLNLDVHGPEHYVEAIRAAEQAGYDVLIIDSLSHAWAGRMGALEQVDKEAARSKSGNSYTAWRNVTPKHNALVDAIVGSKCHVIATLRTKTEYVLEEGRNGKKVPKKVGMAPIQRDGMEYEFDICGELDYEHRLIVTKTRCAALDEMIVERPGEDLAGVIREWLTDGVEAGPDPAPASEQMPVSDRLSATGDREDRAQNSARVRAGAAVAGSSNGSSAKDRAMRLIRAQGVSNNGQLAKHLASIVGREVSPDNPLTDAEWGQVAEAAEEDAARMTEASDV